MQAAHTREHLPWRPAIKTSRPGVKILRQKKPEEISGLKNQK